MEGGITKMKYVTKLRGADLTATEYMVLMTIWTYSDEHMQDAFPSVARLSDDTGLSRRTVQRSMATLRTKGFLSVAAHGGNVDGKNLATRYRLSLPAGGGVMDDAPGCHGRRPGGVTGDALSDPLPDPLPDPPSADIVPMPDPDAPEPQHGGRRTGRTKTRPLLHLARAIAQARTDDDHEHASEEFLDAFADQYGDDTEARDLYWNRGFDERLHQLAREGGIDYGTATWLGIFTNTYQAAS